jgi:predicted RNA-binding protein with PUA-like domain
VVELAQPDPTQFDRKSEYYDPKARQDQPIWFCVKVGFVEKFPQVLSLPELREQKPLAKMLLLKKGQRLSIQPVSKEEFAWVQKMARKK